MKNIAYIIFAFWFYIGSILPLKKNRVFLIMTHDTSKEGNVGVVKEYLEQHGKYEFISINRKKERGLKNLFKFVTITAMKLATSKYIFMDNVFLPMAYLKFKKSVKVVQLWHGTGTIKKFGQDSTEGNLKNLEKRANQRTTHLIVNSEYTKKLYKNCFGISEEKIFITGMPRTDILFKNQEIAIRKKIFNQQFQNLRNKKLILYAPTFRDEEINAPKMPLNIEFLTKNLSENYVLGLRLHPHVSHGISLEIKDNKKVIDFSHYENLNTLLFSTDILITDYSSIIFEYCIFKRKMIFYAYDLEQFSKSGRGFYEEYHKFVPGKVVKNNKEILQAIIEEVEADIDYNHFIEQSYKYFDGKSTERLINLIVRNDKE